nr:MAG TPA: hypothetical protein [Caudoviricetes sp.]
MYRCIAVYCRVFVKNIKIAKIRLITTPETVKIPNSTH